MAIKFFVQKDIPHDIQTEVCETIAVRTVASRILTLPETNMTFRPLGEEWSPKYHAQASSSFNLALQKKNVFGFVGTVQTDQSDTSFHTPSLKHAKFRECSSGKFSFTTASPSACTSIPA